MGYLMLGRKGRELIEGIEGIEEDREGWTCLGGVLDLWWLCVHRYRRNPLLRCYSGRLEGSSLASE